MMTVLPTPAPPKMPILPPFLNGQIRSMTLRPVSKTSISVDCWSKAGGSRWIGRWTSAVDRALAVDRLAEDVEDATEGRLADRHRDRRAGVAHVDAAGEPVGRGHRDRADPVVAEVLLDLADERLQPLALDLDGVVDARQPAGRELDVHDGAGDLDDSADRGRCGSRHVGWCLLRPVRRVSGVRAGRDLDHLAGDVGLADLVVREGQVLDEFLGVLGRVLHRDHPARFLARLRLEDGLEEARRDVARKELLEHGRGADGSKMNWLPGMPSVSVGRPDRQDRQRASGAGRGSRPSGCRRCPPGRRSPARKSSVTRRASGRTSAKVGRSPNVAKCASSGTPVRRIASRPLRPTVMTASVARVVDDVAGDEPDDVRVERAGQRPVRRDQDDEPLAARSARPAAGGPRRSSTAARSARTSSSFSLYGPGGQRRVLGSLSFDAATNCIARVICLMFLTEPMRRRMSRWLATSSATPRT